MQILSIYYLIIPSVYLNDVYAFVLNDCFSNTCLFDAVLAAGSTLSLVQTYPVSLSAGDYQAVAVTNTFNIKASGSSLGVLGLALNGMVINNTHYSLDFQSVSGDPIFLQSYYLTLFVFRTPSSSYGVKITTYTLSSPNIINDSNIAPLKTFFGVSKYSFHNADIRFCVTLTSNMAFTTINANMISF